MTGKIDKLRLKVKAAHKWGQRGGKGYFCRKNKALATPIWIDELAAMRARNAHRWAELERAAMANIVQGQRELGRLAA